MMNEAMKNEVFAFAKEVRVNKTKLMELVERVVAMVEVPKTPKVGKVEARHEAVVAKMKEAVGTGPFTASAVPTLTKDTHYLLRALEAKGLVKKVGKVEKEGRGRKDYMWMFVEAE